MTSTQAAPVIELNDVSIWLETGKVLLRDITLAVHPGEHWALIGPNGAGKSTLLSMCNLWRHPSRGSMSVLGAQFGKVDLWDLRQRIGTVNPLQRTDEWMHVVDIVLTGATNTIQPLWDRYGPSEEARARGLLHLMGCGALIGREISTCSQGERQRVRIARSLMNDPAILLLDEPATGLDLPAREALLGAIDLLARTRPELATITVSHHLEDLPPTTTHALLLREGACVAQGDAASTITSPNITATFGMEVAVTRLDGRWFARATSAGTW